jgi:hypothetical protein
MRGALAAQVRVDRVGIRRTAMEDAAWIAIGTRGGCRQTTIIALVHNIRHTTTMMRHALIPTHRKK